jgi:hypothetical protein
VGNTQQALNVYRSALPKGYNVVGINCDQIIQASGALHCITKEISSNNPLLISHKKLEDTYDNAHPYTVSAYIKHRSGISNATLFYRTDSTLAFDSVAMLQGFNPDYWMGDIPPQPVGTHVEYYIKAKSNSGKQQVRPLVAPQGYFEFNVLGVTGNKPLYSNIGNLYPNPSRGITVLPVDIRVNQSGGIYIKDINGKLVETIYEGDFIKGEKNFFVNTQHYPSGVYIVELKTNLQSNYHKLIVR